MVAAVTGLAMSAAESAEAAVVTYTVVTYTAQRLALVEQHPSCTVPVCHKNMCPATLEHLLWGQSCKACAKKAPQWPNPIVTAGEVGHLASASWPEQHAQQS